MLPNRQLTPADFWLIFKRRKWLFCLPCLGIIVGTVLYNMTLPNIYRSSTVILVEAPKVPEAYVQSTVTTTSKERLRTIAEQIKSRTRLEKIITELHLLDGPDDKATLDRYIINMRANLEVGVQANDAFTVSYAATDPHIAMQVTNKLAALFIEENVKVREQYAVNTTEFLDGEMQRIRAVLETQEKVIAVYKQQHMGELPEQQEANQRILDRLQLQLQSSREAIDNAQSRRNLLLRQISLQERDVTPDTPLVLEASNPIEQQLVQQIIQRRQTLQELQRVHTDKYPDISQLQQSLAELEGQLAAHRTGQPSAKQHTQPGKTGSSALNKRLEEEVVQIDLDITKLQRQQGNTQEQITTYEKKVANAARRAQDSIGLTRDYESTKRNYESLLARQMQAQISENLERRQKAEQFRILDPASLSTKPWKPKREIIFMMGVGLGFAVGGGGVFLAEYLDQAFRDPKDLAQFTALPVLATIPIFTTTTDRNKERRRQKLVYAVCMVIPVLTLTAVHVFWIKIDLVFAHTWKFFTP